MKRSIRMLRTLAAAAIVCFATTSCNDCANTGGKRIASPDSARELMLFDRSCGATANGANIQLSIVDAGARVRGGGNVFVADLGPIGAKVDAPAAQLVSVSWESPRRLKVAYDSRLRVFHREERAAGVDVEYQPLTPAERR